MNFIEHNYYESEVNHLTCIDDLKFDTHGNYIVDRILDVAKSYSSTIPPNLEGKVVTNVFFEPSTRTLTSFQAAALRSKISVINIANMDTSSLKKGESVQDMLKTIEQYSDAIVIRTPIENLPQEFSKVSSIPIINAGDGKNEHPTQALLDLFTIKEEIGRIDNFRITFAGDCRFSRTIRSLIRLLEQREGVDIRYSASPFLTNLNARHYEDNVYPMTKKLLAETDILYMTRVQKERIKSYSDENHKPQVLTKELAMSMPAISAIMHPLPRVGEIDEEVDSLPNAAYFRQVKNGMWVRMSILAYLLNN